jgi:hypothetical protein
LIEGSTNPCEFCGEPMKLRGYIQHWKNADEYLESRDCDTKNCQEATAYYFDLGKAQAKGEI